MVASELTSPSLSSSSPLPLPPPPIDHNVDDSERATSVETTATEYHQDNGIHPEPLPPPSTPSSCSMASLIHQLKLNWKVVVLGQGLSFLLACAGAAQATLHLSCGLSAPNFTTSLVYLGLAIIYLPILVCRRYSFWRSSFPGLRRRRRAGERLSTHDDSDAAATKASFGNPPHHETDDGSEDGIGNDNNSNNKTVAANRTLSWSLRWYLMQAFFDVEANAVTMLAFRYTTLTSVTLFDALAIPASMVISRFVFFRSTRRYRPLHYIGVLVCMVGVVLNLYQDYESDSDKIDSTDYPHKMWGDICAITGGILFGLNDVLTEVTVGRAGDTTEYLGMVGIFGFLIAFLQALLLEREEIQKFFAGREVLDDGVGTNDTCSVDAGFLLLFAFAGVTLCSYVGGTHFLVLSEAAFLNLSFLTGDLWSVLFSVVAERIVPQPLFFVALATVLSGVVIYEMAPSPALEKHPQQQQKLHRTGPSSNDEERNDSEQNQHGYTKGVDGIMVVKGGYDSIDSRDGQSDEIRVDSVELKRITIC